MKGEHISWLTGRRAKAKGSASFKRLDTGNSVLGQSFSQMLGAYSLSAVFSRGMRLQTSCSLYLPPGPFSGALNKACAAHMDGHILTAPHTGALEKFPGEVGLQTVTLPLPIL